MIGSLAWPAWASAQERMLVIGEGTASCPAGYVCLWEDAGFRGRGVAMYGDEPVYAALAVEFSFINDRASSFYNRGRTHDVRFGRSASLDNGSFVLCRGESWSGLVGFTRDDAANPGASWNDAASSHDWFTNVWC